MEYSIVTCDEISDSTEPSCPHFRPVADVELLHQLAETASCFAQKDATVSNIFDLCVALWGRLDFYSPESGESVRMIFFYVLEKVLSLSYSNFLSFLCLY